ncbi:MAG TPA: IPTL-CTERM sorting domain-containing protein [Rhodothermales bacterium]|nr:IPTL-CTERM sorting domain-containing protein [Rhodothermales bacterium]
MRNTSGGFLPAFALLLSFAGESAWAAGPWFVSTAGNDANDCLTPATACLTIEGAIAKASSGDTINVAAGTYSGDVNVNKSLTLLGAQAGVNPNDGSWNDTRTNAANESIIRGAVNLSLRNDIVMEGFTIERTETNEGHILIGGSIPVGVGATSSFNVLNNRFVGTRNTGTIWAGIHTNFLNEATLPGAQFTSHQNRITIGGTASGSGILVNANLPGSDGLGSTTITNTYSASAPGNGFNVNRPGASALISGNRLVNDDIFTFRANHTLITGNTISDAPQAAIANTGGSTNWTASENTIITPRAQAFLVGSTFTADPVNDFTVENNTITVDPSLVAVGVNTVFTPFQYAYFDMRGNLTGTNSVTDNTLSLNSSPLNPVVVAVYGLRVRGDVGNLSVANNTLAGNGVGGAGDATLPPSSAVFIDTDTVTPGLDFHATGNLLTGWVNGASVFDTVPGAFGGLAAGATVSLTRNDLSGNSGFGVQSGPGETVDATCNWWGAADGPGPVGPGSGVLVSTNVDFTPFLSSSNLSGGCTADPTTSTVSANPTSVVADGATSSTITVTLRDSAGTPVPGKTVTLTPSSGSSVISPASGPSDASGVVTFTVRNSVAETVTYTATDTTDSVTLTQTATVTFTPMPTLAIDDVTQAEGDSGTTSFVFTVTLTGSTPHTVTVNYATADGTATAGSDYTATSGTLTFTPGTTTQTITVQVIGDTTFEPDETFFVNLGPGVTNATISDNQGLGTITNDDPAVADLSITKTATSPGPYFATQNITYSIAVTNNGPDSATGVTVTDGLPAGTSFVSATPSQGSCSGTTTVTCSLGTLSNGQTATIQLTVRLDSEGNVANVATVTSDSIDPIPANDAATETIAVMPVSAIPTLSEWMLLALAGMLAVIAAMRLRT